MRVPEPLYKKLPLLYALGGLAVLPVFGLSVPIAISALMLLSAAALVSLWRYRHQALQATLRHREQWSQRRQKRAEEIPF